MTTDVTVAEVVAAVLASSDPQLGMTADAARQAMALIADADRSDDDALRAYDLLHARVTFGRAF